MQYKKRDAQAWQGLINDIFAAVPMTQRQFAKEIGVAHNSVHGWLNGRTMPRPKYHFAIIGYCLKHNIENICKKHNLDDLIKPAKKLEKEKRGNFVVIEVPLNLLSGTETMIEIHNELYKIVKIKLKRRWGGFS